MVNCLIVDDDQTILDYVASHLNNEGYHTYTKPSGTAALQFLEQQTVDIAIVDIMMAGMDGFE